MNASTAPDTAEPPTTSPASQTAGLPSQILSIRFTGSGSEYFRIWIVNLLLILVTLSLYYPWAKVRRLRYFYGNTVIDGKPLGFHADPKKILRGYVLVGAMLATYSVAGRLSATSGFIAFVIVAALWPALLKSTMQFRLANTSWRGLRMRFDGSLGGAYKSLLPLFVPGALFVAALIVVPDKGRPPPWYGIFAIAVVLLTLGFLPLLWWNLKKYQHDHFGFGALKTQLQSGPGPFYGVFLRTAAIGVVPFVLLGIVVATLGTSLLAGFEDAVLVFLGILLVYSGMLLSFLVAAPYFKSRMQNLVWSRTGYRSTHFNSNLRFVPLLRLTFMNWLLIVVTLGLYWPFATVSMARLKLEAMSITTRIDPQTVADEGRAAEGDAAGDAAGDLFGIDIGF